MALRFHAQTGGSTLTAQQPENNIVRVAIQALSAVAGGAQSIHTNGFDEALALPTERSAKIALGRQVLAHEAGGTDTADPFGGSYFIEALTTELEEAAWELIERVDEIGGAVAAIEQGFVQREIEDAAFRYQREVEQGERVIVGVNRYQEHEQGPPIELHRLDPEAERRQLERTERVRAERDAEAAGRALEESGASRADENLLFPMREALRLRCTVGGDLRGPARGVRDCTTPSGRSADPPRLADVPGAATPTSACSSRLSRRSSPPRAQEAGRSSTAEAAGRRATCASAATRSARPAASGRTWSTRTSSSRPGCWPRSRPARHSS